MNVPRYQSSNFVNQDDGKKEGTHEGTHEKQRNIDSHNVKAPALAAESQARTNDLKALNRVPPLSPKTDGEEQSTRERCLKPHAARTKKHTHR